MSWLTLALIYWAVTAVIGLAILAWDAGNDDHYFWITAMPVICLAPFFVVFTPIFAVRYITLYVKKRRGEHVH